MIRLTCLCAAVCCFAGPFIGTVRAQSDKVYLADGKVVTGKIEKVLRDGVQVSRGSKTDNIPTGEIRKILYQGDPAGLTRGRELALDGNYDEAIEQLKSIQTSDLTRDVIQADASFYRILSETKLALSGRADRKAAAKSAFEFGRSNSQSWHFYEALRLLGDLALALGNHDEAEKFYTRFGSSRSNEDKVEARHLVGTAKLAKGDLAGATSDFESVVGLDIGTVRGAKIKTLSKAKLAETLAKSGSGDQAKMLIDEIVSDLDTLDSDLCSQVFNSSGVVFESLGDTEGAMLAYLRTELMYANVPEAHAQALTRLSDLWTKVGKPDRAAKAKQQLKQLYPGYSS